MISIHPRNYRTAIDYPAFFHPAQSPTWLSEVLAALGRPPPRGGDGFCEIGRGAGFGAAIIAATHPDLRVTGLDLSPSHIATA